MKLKSSERGWSYQSDCYKEKRMRYKLKEGARSHSNWYGGGGGEPRLAEWQFPSDITEARDRQREANDLSKKMMYSRPY